MYDPSTQNRNVLFNGLSSPRGMVVDPTTGYVHIIILSLVSFNFGLNNYFECLLYLAGRYS